MRNKKILFFFISCLCAITAVQAQNKKIDTTAMFGDAGYHVTCNNKKVDENTVNIAPKGFKNTARDGSIPIRGRLDKVLVDDLNDDGFPDLLLCIYSGINHETGSIYCVSSKENTTVTLVPFPDIYSDPKIREGYKGHDEFTIVAGSLLRSFPIYKSGDTEKPTGGTRVVQYKIVQVAGKPEALTFKLLRSYEK